MKAFDPETFKRELTAQLPHARVQMRAWTPEQRERIRQGLHEINALKSHAAALGYGSLNK
jgi:hypothetical protein